MVRKHYVSNQEKASNVSNPSNVQNTPISSKKTDPYSNFKY